MTIEWTAYETHVELTELGDEELIRRVRAGQAQAYGVLWERYAPVAYRTLRAQFSYSSEIDVDDLVSESFVRILKTIEAGKGPTTAFGGYLVATARNLAKRVRTSKTALGLEMDDFEDETVTADPLTHMFDTQAVQTAFQTLPERWQEVLWLREVEELPVTEIASLMGVKPNAVSRLAIRAREGLRDAWLQAHLKVETPASECQRALQHMGAYARRREPAKRAARTAAHLEDCAYCAAAYSELSRLSTRLPSVLAPIGVLGGGGAVGWMAVGPATPAAAAALAPTQASHVGGILQAIGLSWKTSLGTLSVISVVTLTTATLPTWLPALTSSPTTSGTTAAVVEPVIDRVGIYLEDKDPVESDFASESSRGDDSFSEEILTEESPTTDSPFEEPVREDQTGDHSNSEFSGEGDSASEDSSNNAPDEETAAPEDVDDSSEPLPDIEAEDESVTLPVVDVHLERVTLLSPAPGQTITPATEISLQVLMQVTADSAPAGALASFKLPPHLTGHAENLTVHTREGTVIGSLSGSGQSFSLTFTAEADFYRTAHAVINLQVSPVVSAWPTGAVREISVQLNDHEVSAGELSIRYFAGFLFTESVYLLPQPSSSHNDFTYWYSSPLFTAHDVGVKQKHTLSIDAASTQYAMFNCAAILGESGGSGAVYRYGANLLNTDEQQVNNPENLLGMSITSCTPSEVHFSYVPVSANHGFTLELVKFDRSAVSHTGDAILLTEHTLANGITGAISVTTLREPQVGAGVLIASSAHVHSNT